MCPLLLEAKLLQEAKFLLAFLLLLASQLLMLVNDKVHTLSDINVPVAYASAAYTLLLLPFLL